METGSCYISENLEFCSVLEFVYSFINSTNISRVHCAPDEGALEEITVEGVLSFGWKKLYVPGNMTKDICLEKDKALKTELKKYSLVMCMVVIEN